MLPFSDFRDNWLTPEKEAELVKRAIEHSENLPVKNTESIVATVSASVSLFILAGYHEWLLSQKEC